MPPPTRRHAPRRHHGRHPHGRRTKHYKDRIYFDMLNPSSFLPTGRCSPLESGSYHSRSAKTPRYKARHCPRRARLGRDNRTLYVSVLRRHKNPHYRGTLTGGYHWTYSWKVVYDRRNNKKFDTKHLPPWVLAQIS